MHEELWIHATDSAKIEWLRQQVIALQKRCDELQEQVDTQHLGPAEQAAIDENIRY